MIEKINLTQKFSLIENPWNPHIVGELNDQHVKLAKLQGPFIWHAHENEDELFLVVKGRFRMELRDKSIDVEEGEILIIPRGVEHLPVADDGDCHVLVFEPTSTTNTGTAGGERTLTDLKRI